MSIKLTKRIAADILGRGVSSIKIVEKGRPDAEKAITREDVKTLIKDGNVYAVVEKHNISVYSKILKKKRSQGRRRGSGRRKGTKNARMSIGLEYKRKVRGQRRVLAALKRDKVISNELFKDFYKLVRGGTFANKASLLGHIRSTGISISDERFEQLKHM